MDKLSVEDIETEVEELVPYLRLVSLPSKKVEAPAESEEDDDFPY